VGVTEKELKKLRGYYSSLLGQQQVFDSIAASEWATKDAPVRVLAEEIERIEADFPGLLPPFRLKDFYSHPAYFSGGAYYDVSGIRSYLATALGKVKAELDAAEDRGPAQSDYLGYLEDSEVKQLVRGITGRFVQLGKGSPVHKAKVALRKDRVVLDVLVQRRIIQIIGDKFYPCFLAEELEDAATRNYVRNCTSLVLKALKSLYEMTGASQLSFDQVLTAATRQAGPGTKPEMVRLGMLMAADFSGFVSGFGISDEEGVNSVCVGEGIIDFESLDAAWNEEYGARLVKAGQPPSASPVEPAPSAQARSRSTDEAPQAPQSLETLPGKSLLLSETEGMLKRGGMVSVLFIDLDEFKRVNDTQGHPAGDECLEAVVKITAEAIFHKGKLYRWGGDEFVVVLPNFEVSEATATAERIKEAIGSANLVSGARVTASLGVTSSSQSGQWTAGSLVDAADQAMYRSKDAGRNRVTAHEAAIGDERVSKAKPVLRVPASELARRAEAVELLMSLRQAVSGNYMALVTNESDEEVSVGKISLERNGIELSQPGKPEQGERWIIAPRSGREITWAPAPDPVGTLGMTQPHPSSPVDIEMVVYYEVLERRKVAKRKILVAVDYRNHRMDQFSP